MIVVADTSPLNYLIQIDCHSLLPQLYARIVIPSGVMEELGHTGAPAAVRAWLSRAPAWIDVSHATSPPDAELTFLDMGEREAIQLAQEQHADLLLIDERKGRVEAKRRGLRTTGTLGILLSAGELGRLIPKQPIAVYLRKLPSAPLRLWKRNSKDKCVPCNRCNESSRSSI